MLRLGKRLTTVEELGHGGMGSVLRVHDQLLGRDVAVKVISDEALDADNGLERFIGEAQLGAQLEHPNIVPMYQFLSTDTGKPAFAMRLVEGQSMADYLADCAESRRAASEPPHDLASRLERFLKVCDAIEYAHSRGVIHRDLKPDNVLLGVHNEVYVMDWGLARIHNEPVEAGPPLSRRVQRTSVRSLSPEMLAMAPQLTRVGDVFGSPAYMSPEQARGQVVDMTADQFALGVMLQELVTLQPPRTGNDLVKLLSDALMNRLEPMTHRFGEKVPRSLRAIVRRATQSAVDKRYPSVGIMAEDVRRFLRDEPVSVLADSIADRAWRRIKRRPSELLIPLGLALLSIVVAIVIANLRTLRSDIAVRDRASAQAQRLSAVTAGVSRVARNADQQLARVELLIESLSTGTAELLRRPPPPQVRAAPLAPSELLSPTSSAQLVDHYKQRVSFQRPVFLRAPNATDPALAPLLTFADDIEELMVRTLARASQNDDILAQSPTDQRAAAQKKGLVRWVQVGFEAGASFIYPGLTRMPDGFDARKRPWYVLIDKQRDQVWGAPFPSASDGAFLLPCSRGLFDANGRRIGVASLLIPLDDLLDRLTLRDIDGYRSSYLLDNQGNVLATTEFRGVQFDGGLNDNKKLALQPFAIEPVRQAVAHKDEDGRLIVDDKLIVFQRMGNFDAWLAAVFDAATYTSF